MHAQAITIFVNRSHTFKFTKEIPVQGKLDITRVYESDDEHTWSFSAWVLGEPDFAIEKEEVVAKNSEAKRFLESLGNKPVRISLNTYVIK